MSVFGTFYFLKVLSTDIFKLKIWYVFSAFLTTVKPTVTNYHVYKS